MRNETEFRTQNVFLTAGDRVNNFSHHPRPVANANGVFLDLVWQLGNLNVVMNIEGIQFT